MKDFAGDLLSLQAKYKMLHEEEKAAFAAKKKEPVVIDAHFENAQTDKDGAQ